MWYTLTGDHGEIIGGIPFLEISTFGVTRLYSQALGSYGGWVGERSPAIQQAYIDLQRRLLTPRVARCVITPLSATDDMPYAGVPLQRERFVINLSALAAPDDWRSLVRENIRRNLKSAAEYGWQIDLVQNTESVERTRSLWEHTYDRHQRKFGADTWEFFRQLIDHFAPGVELLWWTAADDQGPAATMICLHSGNRLFYYNGALDLARSGHYPMHALYERAITTALSLNCSVVDLGSEPDTAAGLQHFKSGWGAQTEPYSEYHFRRWWSPRR